MEDINRGKVLTPEEREARAKLKSHFRAQQQRSNQIQTLYGQREGAGELNLIYMSPLLFMPALLVSRLAFRKNPRLGDKVFKATLGVGVAHGLACIAGFY
jgi:hypothetical protein